MDDFTQGMLDRAKQRREALSKKMADTPTRKRIGAQEEVPGGEIIAQDGNDDSPSKRVCLQDINNQLNGNSNERNESSNLKKNSFRTDTGSENMETMNTSPQKSQVFVSDADPVNARKGRFAALAERYKSQENDLTHHVFETEEKKPSKADRYRYPQPDASKGVQPALPKTPTTADQSAAGCGGERKVEVSEPLPLSVEKEKNVSDVEPKYAQTSPVRLAEEEVVLPPPPTIELPKKADGVEEKRMPHVSSMTFVVGSAKKSPEKAGKVASCDTALPSGVTVPTVVQGLQSHSKGPLTMTQKRDNQNDSVAEEPTKKPVSARLAAWQSKVAATEDKPSVSNRIQALERRFGGTTSNKSPQPKATDRFHASSPSSGQKSSARSPAKTSPNVRSSPQGSVQRNSSKKTSKIDAKLSPAAKSISPTKVQPATQNMHERLAKFCESRTNELVEKSRAGRVAELALLENRWKGGFSPDDRERSTDSGDTKRTPSRRRSRSADSPASPSSAKSAKKEETRNRLRADFESKLRTMGFDVCGGDSASIELDAIPEKSEISGGKPGHPAPNSPKEKLPASVTKVALTPKPSTAGGSIYSLIKKSTGGAQPPATAAPSGIPESQRPPVVEGRVAAKTEGDPTAWPRRARHRSAEDESGMDSFDELAEFKKPDLLVDTGRKPSVVTFSSTVQELTMSEQSESGSQLSESESGTTQESTEYDTEDGEEIKSDPIGETDDEIGDGDVSDLLDEAMEEGLEGDCATPVVENRPVQPVTPSVPEPSSASQVVMRRRSSGRNPSRTDDDLEPRGYISLQQYRQQTSRPKSQPPGPSHSQHHEALAQKRATVMVDARGTVPFGPEGPRSPRKATANSSQNVQMKTGYLYPDLRMEIGLLRNKGRSADRDPMPFVPEKPAKQRIQELQDLVSQELNVIQQTSNALNQCCHGGSVFAGSAEAVECHRLLLIACKKRETYMVEMQRLREQPYGADNDGPRGRLTINDLRLPLKSEFTSKFGTMHDTSIHYFIVMIRHGAHVVFTQMVSSQDAAARGSVDFPNLVNLPNIRQNFAVELEVYAMSVDRDNDPMTPKKGKKGLTPKKLLTPRSSRAMQSPGGPTAVRSTNFTNVASLQLVMSHINKTHFTLDRVPLLSPLQGSVHLRLKCLIETCVEERGFLTMFEDVSGFGAWHRRWCVLKGGFLAFWKYPDEEKDREPMGVIDLKSCISECVDIVSREICARPNTFEVAVVRKQQRGDRNTLVTKCYDEVSATKHWISSDTKEERIKWCSKLNETLVNLRAWHTDALRPLKPHAVRV